MLGEKPGFKPGVDVVITMSEKLFGRLQAHLQRVGERNRSAWCRNAIIAAIRKEETELDEE